MSSANDMEKVFRDCSKIGDNTPRVLVLKFLKMWLLFAKAHVLNFQVKQGTVQIVHIPGTEHEQIF